MINFNQALNSANAYFSKNGKTVYKAFENDECWIFYSRSKTQQKPELVVGTNDLMIYKNDGKQEVFNFTSDKCYALLSKSKKVYSID